MMRRAIDLAEEAGSRGEVPVGAVVYRGDEVLAEGFNRRECEKDPTAHAEIVALRAAAAHLGTWRLEGCGIAVTLEPCPMCAGALVNARVERLVYGAADPKAGGVDSLFQLCSDRRLNHRVQVVRGVRAERCGAVLREFFEMRRRSGKGPGL
jgi:tRNA(adenine34) deaminase